MNATQTSPAEQRAHEFARTRGLSPRLYSVVRALAEVLLRLWFRVAVVGEEHIPREGPAIIAPNHKNFLDPFFIGIVTRRPVRYMAKIEMFRGPLRGLLPRLGAFPVRRGGADALALETAAQILADGGLVVVFPEGTRVAEADALGSPHHGAGRLALTTGAPIVPTAITGTSHLWRGALPRARRVQIAFLPAVQSAVQPLVPHGDDAVLNLIDERVWPAVQEEYGRLRARPGLIAAGLTALGVGGGLLARRRLRAGQKPRLLGRVEPRRLRRGSSRARLLARLRTPRRR